MENCIFCKIIAGDIPSERVYEDEKMIVIKDIHPQAPVHLLMIPKTHYKDVTELDDQTAVTLGECFLTLGRHIDEFGLQDGFRLIVNKGEAAGQTVGHLHVHILGGTKMSEKML